MANRNIITGGPSAVVLGLALTDTFELQGRKYDREITFSLDDGATIPAVITSVTKIGDDQFEFRALMSGVRHSFKERGEGDTALKGIYKGFYNAKARTGWFEFVRSAEPQ